MADTANERTLQAEPFQQEQYQSQSGGAQRLLDTADTADTEELLASATNGRSKRHSRMRSDVTAVAAAAVTGRSHTQQTNLPPMIQQQHQQILAAKTATNAFNGVAVPFSELVKLRNSIINREKEVLELKHEVTTLKSIERRQQKDLDHYLAEEDKAPRLIKALREELQLVKEKLKESNNQRLIEERKTRLLSDKVILLAEKTDRYRKLVEQGELESREKLFSQLEEAKKVIIEQDQDNQRHLELAQRNFTKEYERGQHKIKCLESEIDTLSQRLEQSDLRIKDKDKKIAGLTMFNAQKAEAAAAASEECKSCKARRKEEETKKMHDEIREKLPIIKNVKIENLSPTSIKLHFMDIPNGRSENTDNPANFGEIRISISAPVSPHRSEPLLIEKKQRRRPGNSIVEPLLIEGLTRGEKYTLQAFSAFRGVLSKPGVAQHFIADIPPDIPDSPAVSIKTHPPRIEIHLNAPPANEGSAPTKFRLYHTTSDNFAESTLLAEFPITQLVYIFDNPSSDVVHAFQVTAVNKLGESIRSTLSEPCQVEPVPPTPFRPRITKFNRTTALARVQLPRDLPEKCPPVEGYKIVGVCEDLVDLNDSQMPLPADKSKNTADSVVAVEADSVSDLQQKISGLDPAISYVFKVAIKNRSGYSQWSPYSEPICLKKLINSPKAPKFDIITTRSVRITLTEVLESSEKAPPKGVLGFKVYASKQRPTSRLLSDDNNDKNIEESGGMRLVGRANFAKRIVAATAAASGSNSQLNGSRGNLTNEKPRTLRRSQQSLGSSSNILGNGNGSAFSLIVDGLDEADSYYMAITLITAGDEESDRSPVIWVPLAAAIDLPPSPRAARNIVGDNASNLANSGAEDQTRVSISRLNSIERSSNLKDTLGSLQKLNAPSKAATSGRAAKPLQASSKQSSSAGQKSTVDKKSTSGNNFVVEDASAKRRSSLASNNGGAIIAKKK